MSVTTDGYRAAFRRHPAGVAIITLMAERGPVGFTATSLTSLSVDPPLVCFNITHTSSSISALRQADSVIVHVLGGHQVELARRFSRTAEQRFADAGSWSPLDTGEPLLADTPTWLRTEVLQQIPAGDSTLVIGGVTHVQCEEVDDLPTPLVYHAGTFLDAGQAPDSYVNVR
jgi:flavin reductase (DIM6/NTAB) family NADH-FMN oxidoreductase RutF